MTQLLEEDDLRWVKMEGAFNFRDAGGYPTFDGMRVAQGSVFRSDALHELSSRDLDTLESLGVDRIIDLRSPDEIAQLGRGPLGDGRVEYFTASVIPRTDGEAVGAPSGDDVAKRYLWYLDVGGEAIVSAFEIMARPDRGAVVFHCAAGKDRTGVLAAMVQNLLGVSNDDIVADYMLTDRALPAIFARLARDPIHAETIAALPPSRRGVRQETMRGFLHLLNEERGGTETWLKDAGLSSDAIQSLRSKLRVPA